jgi:glycosyltransferase involved in cell wall biosynthesis
MGFRQKASGVAIARHSSGATNLPKRLRILHVTAVAETAAILVKPLAQHQASAGHGVEFACAASPVTKRLTECGIPVHHIPFSRNVATWHHLRALFTLVRLLRANRYDVVHAHTPIAAFIGRIAASIARVPVIIYHHRGSLWDSSSRSLRFLYTQAERIAAACTTHVLTINCIDRRELIERGIFSPARITCVHSGGTGVDLHRFRPHENRDDQVNGTREELGIEENDFVIGFVGRLVREKGLLDLVRAFESLVKTRADARLLLVGSRFNGERGTDLEPEVRTRLASCGLADRVVFTGFREDVVPVLALMDVLVLPSYREGFGMVLAEAMAMGKPVVATATRGARELVQNNVNGLMVPIGDYHALHLALDRLSTCLELRERLGRAGRSTIVDCHSMSRVCSDIDAVYAQLFASKFRRRSAKSAVC